MNTNWPGEKMEKDSDGKYSYEFSKDFDSPLIIFNDGEVNDGEQYPADRGLKGEAGKTYTIED